MPRLPKNAHLEAAIQRFVDDFARIIANAVHQSVFMALGDAPRSRRRSLRAPAPEETAAEPGDAAPDAGVSEPAVASGTEPEAAEPTTDAGESAAPARKAAGGRESQRAQRRTKAKELPNEAKPRRRASKKPASEASPALEADTAGRGRGKAKKAKKAAKAAPSSRGRKASAKPPGSKRRSPEQLKLF